MLIDEGNLKLRIWDIWTHDEDLIVAEKNHHENGRGQREFLRKKWNNFALISCFWLIVFVGDFERIHSKQQRIRVKETKIGNEEITRCWGRKINSCLQGIVKI